MKMEDKQLRNQIKQKIEQESDGADTSDAKGTDDGLNQEMDIDEIVEILSEMTEIDREKATAVANEIVGSTGQEIPDDDGVTGDSDGELSAEANTEQEASIEDLFSSEVEQQDEAESSAHQGVKSKKDLFSTVEKQTEDGECDEVTKDDLVGDL